MHPEPFIEIHPRDAAKLNITDNQWVFVRSRRGKSKFPAKITKAIAPGTVFVPMHWGALWAENSEANALTHPESCPDSLQPELKAFDFRVRVASPTGEGEAVLVVSADILTTFGDNLTHFLTKVQIKNRAAESRSVLINITH